MTNIDMTPRAGQASLRTWQEQPYGEPETAFDQRATAGLLLERIANEARENDGRLSAETLAEARRLSERIEAAEERMPVGRR